MEETHDLGLEDVEQARQVVVLARHLAQVDHLKVCAYTWTLALPGIHPPPLLLDLHKYGHLAEDTRGAGSSHYPEELNDLHRLTARRVLCEP